MVYCISRCPFPPTERCEAALEAGRVARGPAPAEHAGAAAADAAAAGHPHVHPQPGDPAGRVHLLLEAPDAPPHGAHPVPAAL